MKVPFGELVGTLSEWIDIERKTAGVQNETGEIEEEWTKAYRIKANMDFRERGSEEFIMAMQLSPQTTVRCRIRTIRDLSTKTDRVAWTVLGKTTYYTIDSILLLQGRRYQLLELQEKERDATQAI